MTKKLNIGSGVMLKKGYINFDAVECSRGGLKTDVIGKIEDITTVFPPESMCEILILHVIEHLYPAPAKKMLEDCYLLLVAGGKIVVECPDILGIYELYQRGHHTIDSIPKLVKAIYGSNKSGFRELGWHRWSYTQNTMAKLVAGCGFEVVHKGIGMTHGMGKRDLRVEGIKK